MESATLSYSGTGHSRGVVYRAWIVGICTFLLAVLFSYAAYNKLKIYSTFVSQLRQSPVTGGYEGVLSWLVPSLEIGIVLLLIIPKTRLVGLWSAFFLMLAFTVYVYVVPHFFKQQTCSCGGIIEGFTWKEHFGFNIAFTILAGIALSLFSTSKAVKKTMQL